ncbi:MAG: patatin family protein [Oscillospiraceae bacterium]|nr:patatin family protein [Oscillospiraceae bacterium]
MDATLLTAASGLPNGRANDTVTPGCLVLEGGAFRGVYTEGVIDLLMLTGLNLQTTVGTSAGALNGLNYVSGQIGRGARMNLLYRHDQRYVGVTAMRHNKGVIGFDFMFSDEMDAVEPFDYERLMRGDRRFLACVSNLRTGKAEYHEAGKCEDIYQSARASASMPFLSRPVMIAGDPYLDGGCCCKVPYRWALDEGFEKIVVVRTQHRDYRKDLSRHRAQGAAHAVYHAYPEFAESLANSSADYNRQCEELLELEASGRIFMIAPSEPVNISRLEGDMDKLRALYDLGMRDATDVLPALRKYLAK